MQPIDAAGVQRVLDTLKNQDIYVLLEMTTGAYASHRNKASFTASTFIHNGLINFSHGSVAGEGPYRVGLKTQSGWVYAQGLTHWDPAETERLIMAGHDQEGKLVVSLNLSKVPF